MASLEASYRPLGWNDSSTDASKWKAILRSGKGSLKEIALFILAITSVLLSLALFNERTKGGELNFSYTFDTALESWDQYTWWSRYSSANPDDGPAVDQAWDAIIPAHGIVAVDHQWAAGNQLPASMSLPSDSSKGVYVIDAYHQIHCLTIVRKTFYQLSRREPLTFPLGHATHCFDSLRQYVMCTAGDTLLYTWGRNTTGDGQLRKCRDWTALRDWATNHTACYQDTAKPVPLNDHFGHCGDGSDGFVLDR